MSHGFGRYEPRPPPPAETRAIRRAPGDDAVDGEYTADSIEQFDRSRSRSHFRFALDQSIETVVENHEIECVGGERQVPGVMGQTEGAVRRERAGLHRSAATQHTDDRLSSAPRASCQ